MVTSTSAATSTATATSTVSPLNRTADRRRTLPPTRPAEGRIRALRPARGSGRAVRPTSRPIGSVSGPRLLGATPTAVASCSLATASGWRLTDRGIAAILVVGLMIVAAALMVVTMTAVRVTGDTYRPHQDAQSQHEM